MSVNIAMSERATAHTINYNLNLLGLALERPTKLFEWREMCVCFPPGQGVRGLILYLQAINHLSGVREWNGGLNMIPTHLYKSFK